MILGLIIFGGIAVTNFTIGLIDWVI